MAKYSFPSEKNESTSKKIQRMSTHFCLYISDVKLRAVLVLLLGIAICLGVPYWVLSHIENLNSIDLTNHWCLLEHELRISCLPDVSNEEQNKEHCEKVGCCWEEFGHSVPDCFYSYPNDYSYSINNITENDPTRGFNLQISPNFNKTPQATKVLVNVSVSVEYWTESHLRIFLKGGSYFDPYKHLEYQKRKRNNQTDLKYKVSVSQKGVFRLGVARKGDSDNRNLIFNSAYGPLIVSHGLTQITTLLPSFHLYGIGQSPKNSFEQDLKFCKKYTLFSQMNSKNDTDYTLSSGTHPFYLVMENNGLSHGVLLVSSLPVDIIISGVPAVTFRTGDTNLDIHMFLGPSPADVIRQLTDFVGRPSMPPYWALGYHSCRDSADLEIASEYINFTRNQRIPHESDCGTAQVMDSAFVSNNAINGLEEFKNILKSTDRKLIMLQVPHVGFREECNVTGDFRGNFTENMTLLCPDISKNSQDGFLFLRDATGRKIYEGQLSNGEEVYYPDFFNSNISKLLNRGFQILDGMFDGLFLTNNTPLNFNASNLLNDTCVLTEEISTLLMLISNTDKDTVCMGAAHSDMQPHVYYHNMYGYAHMKSVKSALEENQTARPFLTSLSTFTGSGIHGGHWGGEINLSWDKLKQTIVQTLDFNMFGVPLTGLPACGTHGDIELNLCAKWIEVAAFQPLMFTYRRDGQEPIMKHKGLTSVGRIMIQIRYSLLPYLYSLFYNATKQGDTVVRPLMFEFPTVQETYSIDEQFMWGSSLMISPRLKSSSRKLQVYFPPGCWYDFYSGKNESDSIKGRFKSLTTPDKHVSLHVRGGHVIPTQPYGLTTTESRKHNFTLTIAINCLAKGNLKRRVILPNEVLAYGEFFIDDGYSNLWNSGRFILVKIIMIGRNITIEPNWNYSNYTDPPTFPNVSIMLNNLRIYGIPEKPLNVIVDDLEVQTFSYNTILETLMISHLELDFQHNHTITWQPQPYVNS